MADVNAAVQEALSEVKNLGDDAKKLRENISKELENIRSEVGNLSKSAMTDPLVSQKIEAFGASIGTKIEEAQKASAKAEREAAERMDALETAFKRSSMLGHNGGPAMDADERKAAAAFTKAAAVLSGRQVADVLDDADIRFDDFKAYRKAFPAMLRRDERVLSQDTMKALSSGSNPDGGYLVEPTLSARILGRVFETSPIRQLATVETISGTEMEIRLDMDETDGEWVGETDLPNASKTPQLGRKLVVAHTLAARPKATQQLLEDASVDIEAWLEKKVVDKFARLENRAFVAGTGRGMPRGLFTYPAGTTGETIEQLPTGSLTGFTFPAVVGAQYSLKEPYHARASWLMQRASIARVMLVQDGNGQYIFRNVMMPGQRGFETQINGYPVRMAADVPAVAAGAMCAAFGDFGAAYTIVDRLGITTQRDPFTAKPFVEFYTRRRTGGDVVNFEAVKILIGAT